MNSNQVAAILIKKLCRWDRLLFVGVIALGGGIRFLGMGKGLPYTYYPDEPNYVDIVQRIFKTGDLNPRFFSYPSLFFYLNSFAYVPYYLFGLWKSVFQSLADIRGADVLLMGVGLTPLPSAFLLGRSVTALFGIGSIGLVFVIGQELTRNWRTGFVAALMLALSPTHAEYSRYMFPHAVLVFFLLLTFWACFRLYLYGGLRNYLLTGIGCGLAASTMYHGALIMVTLIVAHSFRAGLRGWRDIRLYVAIGLALLTFTALNPYMLLDSNQFLHDTGFIFPHYLFGTGGSSAAGLGNAFAYYVRYSWGVEGALLVFAAIELVRGVLAWHKPSILVYSFALPYFIVISSATVRNPRTFLPVIPFLICSAAILATTVCGQLSQPSPPTRKARTIISLAASLVLVLALVFPAARTIQGISRLLAVDSRETARVWISQDLPPGSRLALESYSPYVDPHEFDVNGFFRLIDHSPEWYISNQFDYLVSSQGMFKRFYDEPELYAVEISKYEALFQHFDEVKAFGDGGYEIRIYRTAGK
ncbi:MAG TPA: phospholipid carrier-dependent glycosyltransferase [Anaerolineales bacterium]|nr:phospholipid carrier-dependent glycosyltransferase [Anaerolineales bacterium]